MSNYQTVEVTDGQDIILMQDGTVVAYIGNNTRDLSNGAKYYDFQGRSIRVPYGVTDNAYSFSVSGSVALDGLELADITKLLED